MKQGRVILINGASSSGKTSIVKALQASFEEPYLDAGLDRFLWMLPGRYLDRPLWDDVLGLATTAGQTGHQLVLGMHRAIGALARAGNNVVADHVLVESSWVSDCAASLADLDAWLVGVYCPLEVLIEREGTRADRTLGQAQAQHKLVHQFAVYDLEVDTSVLAPDQCAQAIRRAISMGEPRALRQLRGQTPRS